MVYKSRRSKKVIDRCCEVRFKGSKVGRVDSTIVLLVFELMSLRIDNFEVQRNETEKRDPRILRDSRLQVVELHLEFPK